MFERKKGAKDFATFEKYLELVEAAADLAETRFPRYTRLDYLTFGFLVGYLVTGKANLYAQPYGVGYEEWFKDKNIGKLTFSQATRLLLKKRNNPIFKRPKGFEGVLFPTNQVLDLDESFMLNDAITAQAKKICHAIYPHFIDDQLNKMAKAVAYWVTGLSTLTPTHRSRADYRNEELNSWHFVARFNLGFRTKQLYTFNEAIEILFCPLEIDGPRRSSFFFADDAVLSDSVIKTPFGLDCWKGDVAYRIYFKKYKFYKFIV